MLKPAAIITRRREFKQLSKAKLAEKLGVSRATVTRYEDGTRSPSRDILPKLSKILCVPQAALAGLEEWPAPEEAK
jgi:putative transcriptional regulator